MGVGVLAWQVRTGPSPRNEPLPRNRKSRTRNQNDFENGGGGCSCCLDLCSSACVYTPGTVEEDSMTIATMLDEAHATLMSANDNGASVEVVGRYEDGRPLSVTWDREQFDAFVRDYGVLPTMITVYTIEAE